MEEYKSILVRLPKPLLDELTRLAVRRNRSRNGEIVTLLQEGVEDAKRVYRPNDESEAK